MLDAIPAQLNQSVEYLTTVLQLVLLRLESDYRVDATHRTSYCGFSSSGLPIGMQIIGDAYDESAILRVANAYEQATKWYKQHPQIS